MQTTVEDTLERVRKQLDAIAEDSVAAFEADLKRIFAEARAAARAKFQALSQENENPSLQTSEPSERVSETAEEWLARFDRENPWFEEKMEATRRSMAAAESHQRFLKMVAAHVRWLEAKLTPTPKPKRTRKKRA